MGKVGLPLAIVGIAYITIASKWLLPDRSSGAMQLLQVPRDYTVNAKVAPTSQLVGQTVHALRNLEGLFLVDVSIVVVVYLLLITCRLREKTGQ